MGKNYRNRNLFFMQTLPPLTLLEDPLKRKESTTNYSWSASTVSKTSVKFGEFTYCFLVSERPPDSCLPLSRKILEGSLKELLCSTECTDTVYWLTKNLNSITCWVSPWTNFWTNVFKPVFIKKVSKRRVCIKLVFWSTRDTLKLVRIWSTLISFWWELRQRRRSIWLLSRHSRLKSLAVLPARKIKERKQLRNEWSLFNHNQRLTKHS